MACMKRVAACLRIASAFAALVVLVSPPLHAGEPATFDSGVIEGVVLARAKEYSRAIEVLDDAVERLDRAPERRKDLAQAYLFLGVAHFGKGRKTKAREMLVSAARHDRDVRLDPAEFPPQLIALLTDARREAARDHARKPDKKSAHSGGGMSTPLLILGLAGGGGAAYYIATRDKGQETNQGSGIPTKPTIPTTSTTPTPSPTPSPTPAPTQRTKVFTGIFDKQSAYREEIVGPGMAGHWTAVLSWDNPGIKLQLDVYSMSKQLVTTARYIGAALVSAEWDGKDGDSYIFMFSAAFPDPTNITPLSYELKASYPSL